MSNNKTVVPGMGNPYGMGENSRPQNPFASNPQPAAYGSTVFPGMNQAGNAAVVGGTTEVHKPIMGFLYSVSRTASGEYWPLYMGLNTIGRSTSCSVRLTEGTISDNHAEIVIRQMKNPDSVLVSIQDARSTCGTLLNGSSLGFDAQECHNGDIITIGEHYELYFILIDAKSLNLEPRADFIPAGAPIASVGTNAMPSQGVTSAYSQPMGGQYVPNMGVGVHSPVQGSNSTVIMPSLKK